MTTYCKPIENPSNSHLLVMTIAAVLADCDTMEDVVE